LAEKNGTFPLPDPKTLLAPFPIYIKHFWVVISFLFADYIKIPQITHTVFGSCIKLWEWHFYMLHTQRGLLWLFHKGELFSMLLC